MPLLLIVCCCCCCHWGLLLRGDARTDCSFQSTATSRTCPVFAASAQVQPHQSLPSTLQAASAPPLRQHTTIEAGLAACIQQAGLWLQTTAAAVTSVSRAEFGGAAARTLKAAVVGGTC